MPLESTHVEILSDFDHVGVHLHLETLELDLLFFVLFTDQAQHVVVDGVLRQVIWQKVLQLILTHELLNMVMQLLFVCLRLDLEVQSLDETEDLAHVGLVLRNPVVKVLLLLLSSHRLHVFAFGQYTSASDAVESLLPVFRGPRLNSGSWLEDGAVRLYLRAAILQQVSVVHPHLKIWLAWRLYRRLLGLIKYRTRGSGLDSTYLGRLLLIALSKLGKRPRL